MKIVITGVNGLLGYEIAQAASNKEIKFAGIGRKSLSDIEKNKYFKIDIRNFELLEKFVKRYMPNIIIHCAAWTDVDLAEEVSNREEVYSINVNGTNNLVKICNKYNIKLMFISSDYIFSGDGTAPWKEKVVIRGNPKNFYGITKLIAEQIIYYNLKKYYIIRTSWIFGNRKDNFVDKISNKILTGEDVLITKNQIGRPTYVGDLARKLLELTEKEIYGIYHITNSGDFVSKYEFGLQIKSYLEKNLCKNIETKIVPVNELANNSYAKRPNNCRLEMNKILNMDIGEMPDWKDSLSKYIQILVREKEDKKYVESN